MERQFTKEIESLRLGDGATFHGEGILAVTKALLQSGVSYVGGYQGAPVSHLLDVMVQAKDYLDELGVHVEACTNEASAAAMLGNEFARRGQPHVGLELLLAEDRRRVRQAVVDEFLRRAVELLPR